MKAEDISKALLADYLNGAKALLDEVHREQRAALNDFDCRHYSRLLEISADLSRAVEGFEALGVRCLTPDLFAIEFETARQRYEGGRARLLGMGPHADGIRFH